MIFMTNLPVSTDKTDQTRRLQQPALQLTILANRYHGMQDAYFEPVHFSGQCSIRRMPELNWRATSTNQLATAITVAIPVKLSHHHSRFTVSPLPALTWITMLSGRQLF